MAILFADTFTTGDTSTLGANYTESASDSAIVSNKMRVGDGLGILLTTSTAHADTADVKVTVTQASATGDGGPLARCTEGGATPTMYELDSYPNVLELFRHNSAQVGTLLATGIANTTAANGVLALEVSGVGATVTVKSYLGGVEKQSVADTNASRLTTAGRTGIFQWISGGTTARDYDTFQVEDLAAGAAFLAAKQKPILQAVHRANYW